MNAKLLIFLVAIVVVAGLVVWSGKENGNGETDTSRRDTRSELPSGHPAVGLPLPSISKATIAVQGPDGTDLGDITLVPGEPAPLPNTEYRLRLTEFYTHWNWDKRPVNFSYNERNPAVRVNVFLGDSLLYYQWAFRDMKFFRRGTMGAHRGTETDQLAFTLLSYEDLSLPNHRSEME